MSLKNTEIKAIHIADLEKVLKQYGQLDEFKGGTMRCKTCSNKIHMSNVGSMKLSNKKLVFYCNSVSCYEKLIKNMQWF